jgi:hypothetical protein
MPLLALLEGPLEAAALAVETIHAITVPLASDSGFIHFEDSTFYSIKTDETRTLLDRNYLLHQLCF